MEQGIGNKNKISLKFCLNSMLNERKLKKVFVVLELWCTKYLCIYLKPIT